MKHIYLIGGTMGVGKTTTCQMLKTKLPNSVFLDGDWCWDASPFTVTEETKAMVMDNICHLLCNFIRCSAYDNIIFCWVMHEQSIIDGIISRLNLDGCKLHTVSLVCTGDALRNRLTLDVEREIRKPEVIVRRKARVQLYENLDTVKIDVSNITPEEAAEKITEII